MNLTFKIVIGGSPGSGKSSLVKKLLDNSFKYDIPLTIGVDFEFIRFNKGDNTIKINIWDFGGADRFTFLIPSYITNAIGGIIVFDLSSDRNYQTVINEWMEIFLKQSDNDIPFIFIGNKVDLVDDNYKSKQRNDIEKFVNKMNSVYIETSARTGHNVDECFHKLINKIL